MSSTEPSVNTATVDLAGRRGGLLARAIFGVAAITVAGKILGFAEKVLVAHYFGTTARADAYLAVMGTMWLAVFCVKELLYPSLLPVYSAALSRGEGFAEGLFRRIFLWVLMLAGGAALAMAAASPWVVDVLLPGFSGLRRETAVGLLRRVAPGTIVLALMVVTYTCLNARHRFIASAAGETLFRALVITGLLACVPLWGAYAAAPVVAVAAATGLVFHLRFLPDGRRLLHPGPLTDVRDELRDVRVLIRPLVIGVACSHVVALVDNLIASGLPEGQLSCLTFGKKVIDAVLIVGPVAMVTVVYSRMAHLNSVGMTAERTALIAKAFRFLLYLCLPLAVMLFETRTSLVSVMFQRGKFDAVSVSGTALALGVYALGLVTFALEALFVYCFYANSDTKTPVIWGVVFVAVDIALAFLLVGFWSYLGIAVALVLAKTGKLAVLGILLRRRYGDIWGERAGMFVLRLTAAALACWAALRGCAALTGLGLISAPAGQLVVSITIGTGIYASVSYLVRMEESRSVACLLSGIVVRLRGGSCVNEPGGKND